MKLQVWDGLRRKWIEKSICESLAWKTVIEVYEKKYGSKRIEKYLESVRFEKNLCLIKTQKPIIIAELLPYASEIQKKLSETFQKVWINIQDLNIKII
jgi:hypothetical protein